MNPFLSYSVNNIIEEDVQLNSSSTVEENDYQHISTEMIPMVKNLISLCATRGLFVKILNRSTVIRRCLINDLDFDITAAYEATGKHIDLAYHNFGLAFGVGIYESSATGKLKYLDHKVYYDMIGKIGESIGLTWAANHPLLTNLRYFEFRPNWATKMGDKEMINELYRRKDANLSLIA